MELVLFVGVRHVCEDLVDASVFDGLFSGQPLVAVAVGVHLFYGLAAVLCENFVQSLPQPGDLVGFDFEIGSHAGHNARDKRLMEQHSASAAQMGSYEFINDLTPYSTVTPDNRAAVIH